jgi:hypothetical protein
MGRSEGEIKKVKQEGRRMRLNLGLGGGGDDDDGGMRYKTKLHMAQSNETATDEIIKEQAKMLGQQMSVINFVHKNLYVFCSIK